MKRIFRGIVWISIVFSAICFLSYLFSVLAHAGTFFSYALPITACTVIIAPPLTECFWKRKLPAGAFSFLRSIYIFGVLFFTLTFSVFCIGILRFETEDFDGSGEEVAVLIYGCRVKGEVPGEMLSERLDAAISILEENPLSVAIVSGGLDEGEIYTEGQVMAWYLQKNGIDASRILIDETASSTKGNIRGFLALIEAYGLQDYTFVSVSSAFHMPRIAFLCSRYGLQSALVGADTQKLTSLFPAVVREYMAYIKMLMLNDYR